MGIKLSFSKLSTLLVTIQILFIALTNMANAAEAPKTNIKTLVIVSHPYPERSVMTKGLQQAAESVEGVTVRNLETLYGFDT